MDWLNKYIRRALFVVPLSFFAMDTMREVSLDEVDQGSDIVTPELLIPLSGLDGKEIKIPLKWVRYSVTLEELLKDTKIVLIQDSLQPLAVGSIKTDIMWYIFTELIPALEKHKSLNAICADKDLLYMVDLLNAVNYLNIKNNVLEKLIWYCAQRIKESRQINDIHELKEIIPLPLLKEFCVYFASLSQPIKIRKICDDRSMLISALSILPLDESRRVIAGYDSGIICVWDQYGKKITSWQAHEESIKALCSFKVNNDWVVVSGSDDGTVCIWDLFGKKLATCTGHTEEVSAVAPLEWENQVIVISGSYDGTIRLWNMDGTERLVYKGHACDIYALCGIITKQGPLVISGSGDKTVQIFGLDGVQKAQCKDHVQDVTSVRAVQIGNNIRIISSARDNRVCIWDLQGALLSSKDYKKEILLIDVLKIEEEKKLVVALSDGTVYIQDFGGEVQKTYFFSKNSLIDLMRVDWSVQSGIRIVCGMTNGALTFCTPSSSLRTNIKKIKWQQVQKIYTAVKGIDDPKKLYAQIKKVVKKPSFSCSDSIPQNSIKTLLVLGCVAFVISFLKII